MLSLDREVLYCEAMKHGLNVVVACTALWLATPGAHALSKVSGATLSHACKAAMQIQEHSGTRPPANEQTDAQNCIAYLDGVFDTAEDVAMQVKVINFCLSPVTNRSVLLHVIVQFIDTNPRELGVNGAEVVRDAMMHTYPCSGH